MAGGVIGPNHRTVNATPGFDSAQSWKRGAVQAGARIAQGCVNGCSICTIAARYGRWPGDEGQAFWHDAAGMTRAQVVVEGTTEHHYPPPPLGATEPPSTTQENATMTNDPASVIEIQQSAATVFRVLALSILMTVVSVTMALGWIHWARPRSFDPTTTTTAATEAP
jgi:hypothetical protein